MGSEGTGKANPHLFFVCVKLVHCVVYFRSLSQNSSVLPEEEDEKSCSESEACRHKLAADQQEVCVCETETKKMHFCLSQYQITPKGFGYVHICLCVWRIVWCCELPSYRCSRGFTERSDSRQREPDSLLLRSHRPLVLHRDPAVLHHHLP